MNQESGMSDMDEVSEKAIEKKRGVNLKVVGVVMPLVIAFGLSGFFFMQWQRAKKAVAETEEAQQAVAQREIKAVVDRVGKLILLPVGETPTLVTIDDKTKISDNLDFFRDSENDDQVLIYREAKKAYLYRPGENRLINVGAVTFNENQGEISGTLAQNNEEGVASISGKVVGESTAKVLIDEEIVKYSFAVRNGAGISGIAGKYSRVIEEKVVSAEIVETTNAEETDYQKSVLVSFIDNEEEAEKVAEVLGVELAELPEGEGKPGADFLVIVGRDQAGE